MFTKSAPVVLVKAGPGDGLAEGQFEALVSIMGNKDSYGDVVMPGAFNATLAEWKASGNPIPVIWSHRYDDPDNHIGVVLDAAEKTIDGKTGLWVKGQLDTDPEAKKALQVARLMRGKRVTQFSFSYDVRVGAMEKSEELGDYYALRDVKLYEVGPTLIGANQETELINAKALQDIAGQVKAGRVISAKNETLLRTAHESIGAVLAALDDGTEGKAGPRVPSKAVELPEIGDRVTIDPEHRHEPTHDTGTVAEIGTTAYGLVMDAMPEMGVHRWYTADEFTLAATADTPTGTPTGAPAPGGAMGFHGYAKAYLAAVEAEAAGL